MQISLANRIDTHIQHIQHHVENNLQRQATGLTTLPSQHGIGKHQPFCAECPFAMHAKARPLLMMLAHHFICGRVDKIFVQTKLETNFGNLRAKERRGLLDD